jgi:hypothetical protein
MTMFVVADPGLGTSMAARGAAAATETSIAINTNIVGTHK